LPWLSSICFLRAITCKPQLKPCMSSSEHITLATIESSHKPKLPNKHNVLCCYVFPSDGITTNPNGMIEPKSPKSQQLAHKVHVPSRDNF
jgi:hypothetical protein